MHNFRAAIALAETFRQDYRLPGAIKWPNDILIHGKKISGVLLELHADSSNIDYLNIGVGVNRGNTLTPALSFATSLSFLTGRHHCRREFLLNFLEHFISRDEAVPAAGIIEVFKQLCSTLGREAAITLKDGETCRGVARGPGPDGALEILTTTGGLKKIHYGDCSYL